MSKAAPSARPAALPLRLDDVAVTPGLEAGLRQLEQEYGPMYRIMLDKELARRAQLQTCGIHDHGAVLVEIRSAADPDTDGKTMTAHTVRIVKSSFDGASAERVKECVQGAILHETVETALDGPSGVHMDPRKAVEFDFVAFPIEDDEIYAFLRTGSMEAFHARETKRVLGL
jgi:hypothetical protein